MKANQFNDLLHRSPYTPEFLYIGPNCFFIPSTHQFLCTSEEKWFKFHMLLLLHVLSEMWYQLQLKEMLPCLLHCIPKDEWDSLHVLKFLFYFSFQSVVHLKSCLQEFLRLQVVFHSLKSDVLTLWCTTPNYVSCTSCPMWTGRVVRTLTIKPGKSNYKTNADITLISWRCKKKRLQEGIKLSSTKIGFFLILL